MTAKVRKRSGKRVTETSTTKSAASSRPRRDSDCGTEDHVAAGWRADDERSVASLLFWWCYQRGVIKLVAAPTFRSRPFLSQAYLF